MNVQTYVLVNQVHFGSLKYSVPKGTKFVYLTNNDGTNSVVLNGEKLEISKDIDVAIKAGFAIPFIEGKTKIDTTVKKMKGIEDKRKKMTIDKSDADQMKEVIDISHTKNDVIKAKKEEERAKLDLKLIKEDDTKIIRGLKVIGNDALRETSLSEQDTNSNAFNTDAKTVKKIAKTNNIEIDNDKEVLVVIENKESSEKPVAALNVKKISKLSEEKAKNRAETRKKQADALREKAAKEEK